MRAALVFFPAFMLCLTFAALRTDFDVMHVAAFLSGIVTARLWVEAPRP